MYMKKSVSKLVQQFRKFGASVIERQKFVKVAKPTAAPKDNNPEQARKDVKQFNKPEQALKVVKPINGTNVSKPVTINTVPKSTFAQDKAKHVESLKSYVKSFDQKTQVKPTEGVYFVKGKEKNYYIVYSNGRAYMMGMDGQWKTLLTFDNNILNSSVLAPKTFNRNLSAQQFNNILKTKPTFKELALNYTILKPDWTMFQSRADFEKNQNTAFDCKGATVLS